jgi:SagB-type dehydrogenase family enzyme
VPRIHRYHDGTKHHFHAFARSLGYLDWASQPNPFRSFAGAPAVVLPPRPGAVASCAEPALDLLGAILRYSLGLSAWKQFRDSRWSLRVNPSSGNLHPTEAYVVCGDLTRRRSSAPDVSEGGASVSHYAPDRHVLEQRCAFDREAWARFTQDSDIVALVALTSIHWRESWKYGERAFRYCQHDLGHAIAAIRYSAALAGCRATLVPEWSQKEIATLIGIDRDDDYVDAEREEAGCLLAITRHQPPAGSPRSSSHQPPASSHLLAAVRGGTWTGRANQLSEAHVTWSFIDEIARATEDAGRSVSPLQLPNHPITQLPTSALLLQRRSAVALDGRSSISAAGFFAILAATLPGSGPPWDALWWDARIHLLLFVHRVDGLEPGLYLLPRNPAAVDRLKAACGRSFDWAPVIDSLPLVGLAQGDCRALAQRVSCNQEIAADGFFSLGMIADFDASLAEFGPSFYRHLFWESGVVGHVLYLEAEAAGARGTGIGCFFDDPVHDVLGLTGHSFQSLYHFTIGTPVEDTRLTTEPGYGWERVRGT